MHSEIRTLLSSTFGRLLEERHSAAHARRALPAHDAAQLALWKELAEGGWLEAGAEAFQAEYGPGTLLMGEWTGRALLTLPYGPSAFLAQVLLEQEPALSPVVLDLAAHPASIRCDRAGDEDGWIDDYGPSAQYLRLSRMDGGWRLARLDPAMLEPVQGLDPTTALARLRGPAQAEAELPDGQVLPALQNHQAFLLAQLTGAAGAALDLAIAYAKEREQFGRAIGQFQAVKHPLVDAWIGLDNSRYAVEALLRSRATLDPALAAAATRVATAAARRAVKLSIQVHGGIGFSWEHDAQLYLKRAYRLAVEAERSAALLQG
ncbi:acyl-CoA dehydrogenase [Achromobacter sp. RTa]|uniref:acyl-CoA dehydrogenase family protein n=1 Tax=Achromobacter sp. RTa TaxID=1532557 RepID=UPI00050F4858|nr:acyl-CoA dehydrogenase family protein [Achromobacter sp. RTa]KGD90062.1 acyl-CoA dehydrogenase [Achromobacter sp. RTa]